MSITSGTAIAAAGYYSLDGYRNAVSVHGTISYLASDLLGSAEVALNTSGSATASVLYGPYGTTRYASGTMPGSYGFTGQHSDSVTGLDYYGARYYDPSIGQFTSADSDPKGGLNRYAYVGGNPETRTDPTGHLIFSGDGGGGGGGSTGGTGGNPWVTIIQQIIAWVQHAIAAARSAATTTRTTAPTCRSQCGGAPPGVSKHNGGGGPGSGESSGPQPVTYIETGVKGAFLFTDIMQGCNTAAAPDWCSRYFTTDGGYRHFKYPWQFIGDLEVDFFFLTVTFGFAIFGIQGTYYYIPKIHGGGGIAMAFGAFFGPIIDELGSIPINVIAGFGVLLTTGTPNLKMIEDFLNGVTISGSLAQFYGYGLVYSWSPGGYALQYEVSPALDASVAVSYGVTQPIPAPIAQASNWLCQFVGICLP